MQRRRFLGLLGASVTLAVASGLTACTYRGYDGRLVRYPIPRSLYDYFYYPDANVYFDGSSGYYYYRDRGVWLRSRRLPDRYHLNPAHRRRLVIRRPHPYERNREHRREWEHRREIEHRGGQSNPLNPDRLRRN